MENSPSRFNRLDYVYKLLAVIALSITGIILARDIVIPIAFAGLFSIVLLPIVKRLEKIRIPSALAITIVLLATVIIMGLFVWLVVTQITGFANDLPNLEPKFENLVGEIRTFINETLNLSLTDQGKILEEVMKTTSSYLGNFLVTTTTAISTFIQIPIYIFLFLIYRDKFKKFFLKLIPNQETGWRNDIEGVIRGYISGLALVTLIITVLNTTGLLILGIDHAIFFGVLSGLLTIIPYVGIIIGALFPIIMALITKDSLWYAIGVVIVFAVVQFLEGNFITPKITGSKVRVNALAAIIALLIGAKILGIAGMILAIPAMGILRILLAHTDHLKPFVVLLDDLDEEELKAKRKSRKKRKSEEPDDPDSEPGKE